MFEDLGEVFMDLIFVMPFLQGMVKISEGAIGHIVRTFYIKDAEGQPFVLVLN
jgi:hypothetical protein